MASVEHGLGRDDHGVRVVRTSRRRDAWAAATVAVGLVAGWLVLGSGAARPPAVPAPARAPAPAGDTAAPALARAAPSGAPAGPTVPRTRAGKLRALRRLGVEPRRGPDGKPQLDAAPVIDALNAAGVHDGIAAFGRPGTDPPKRGVIVPDDWALPEGYVRHYQSTDDGRALPPILMFHPDYDFVDEHGNPIAVPPDRVVPPELVPPGFPVEMLDLPEPGRDP